MTTFRTVSTSHSRYHFMEMERDPQRIGSAVFPLELKQLYVAAHWFRNRGGNSSIPASLTVERSVDCVLVKKNSQGREATTIVCCHRSSGPTYRQIIQIRVDGHSAVADIVFS